MSGNERDARTAAKRHKSDPGQGCAVVPYGWRPAKEAVTAGVRDRLVRWLTPSIERELRRRMQRSGRRV